MKKKYEEDVDDDNDDDDDFVDAWSNPIMTCLIWGEIGIFAIFGLYFI